MRALLFLLPLFAHAGDCLEKDFREQLGYPRSQDGTAWCYANSAADLLTQAVGQRISSVDLATTYLLSDANRVRRLKDPRIRDYLRKHPDFEVRLHESRKDDISYQPEKLLGPEGVVDTGGKDDEAIVLSNLKGLCLASRLPQSEKNLEKYLESIRDDYLSIDEDEVPPGPIGAVENDVARIMAHAFQKWVDQRCGKRLKPKKALLPEEVAVADNLEEYNRLVASEKVVAEEAHALLMKELDRVLDVGKVAAIGYESFDLYPKGELKSGHGDHSSVVAARKKIDGVCMYFVRNHYGPTCGYRKEHNERCEKDAGGVWVPAEALRHLYSVISIR